MKKLFLSIAAAALTLTVNAQQTEKQMATLQHGDQTQVFYGPDAFISACDAAADTLDVITLSSGEFNVPSTISKSIAIYGVGFENDKATQTDKTYLNGSLKFIPANTIDGDGQTIQSGVRVNGVHLEGLYCGSLILGSNNATPIHNLELVKCRFSGINFEVENYDCVIRQCYVSGSIYGKYTYSYVTKYPACNAHNLLISNSYLDYQIYGFINSSTLLVQHCIYRGATEAYTVYTPYTFIGNICYTSLPSGSTSYNNIFVGSGTPTQDEHSNWSGVSNADLWEVEGEEGGYAEDKNFALKNPGNYVGNDGTEIGLHGGEYAWNKIPCIPRITECTIDTKDAANGTIKVSIKAEAQAKE